MYVIHMAGGVGVRLEVRGVHIIAGVMNGRIYAVRTWR